MCPLAKPLHDKFLKTIKEAREVAEDAARRDPKTEMQDIYIYARQ